MSSSSVDTQSLIASFALGTVVVASSAAIYFFVKQNALKILRETPRLVLVGFLCFSALWALVDFIASLIYNGLLSNCHIAVGFASSFDQLARLLLAQSLVWVSYGGVNLAGSLYAVEGALFLRFVLGGVFVGVQRPQFKPVCVTSTLILPLAIAALVFDMALVFLLLARSMFNNSFRFEAVVTKSDMGRNRSLLPGLTAFSFWTAMSSPMIVGIESVELVLRTTLPAIGLIAVIVFVTVYKDSLSEHPESVSKSWPEDPQPRGFGPSNVTEVGRQTSRPSTYQPPSRYADVKVETATAAPIATGPRQQNRVLPPISQPNPGQSNIGVGGVAVQGQLFPPPRRDVAPPSIQEEGHKARFWNRLAKNNGNKPGGLVISNPIMNDDCRSPWNRIATVDLETAAESERQRRQLHAQPMEMQLIATRRAPQPPSMTTEQIMARSSAVPERKIPVHSVGKGNAMSTLEPIMESTQASSSSAQLSPGVEELRRRSPLRPNSQFIAELPSTPVRPIRPSRALSTSTTRSLRKDPWELLSIPNSEQNTSSNSSTNVQMSNPSATRISSTSSTISSRPSSNRKSRAAAPVFTDPNAPPPIPQSLKDVSQQHQENDTELPPPYIAGAKVSSPRDTSKPLPPAPLQPSRSTIISSKADARLLIFPPSNPSQYNLPPSAKVSSPVTSSTRSTTSVLSQVRNIYSLPANPRPQRTHTGKSQGRQEEQKIMFVNRIEYDTPYIVEDIVGDHKAMIRATSNNPNQLSRDLSVVHRPRPIPRRPEFSVRGQLFSRTPTYEPLKRSLSHDSLKSKKSILRREAGSPTNLPPLPSLPSKDSNVPWPRLSQAKSMTFDEKIALFLPPSSPDQIQSHIGSRRRSRSLPDISQSNEDLRASLSQFTNDVWDDVNEQGKPHGLIGVPLPLKYNEQQHVETLATRLQHQSSGESEELVISLVRPLSPLEANPRQAATTNENTQDAGSDKATELEFINSPAKAVNLQQAKAVFVSRPQVMPANKQQSSRSKAENDTTKVASSQEHLVPIVLSSTLEPESPIIRHIPAWHRRVGDECPSFSTRKGETKIRKMPPPTPLLLKLQTPKFVEAEPSPLESPQQALQVIEEQLRNLDSPNQGHNIDVGQRMTLLEDLEMEMGVQETRWQNMRHTYIRDSLSTVDMSPKEHSRAGTSSPSASTQGRRSLKSVLAERRESRYRSGVSKDSTEPFFTMLSGPGAESPANRWKKALAEAELRNSRAEMLSNTGSRVSFLTVSHPAKSLIGSPTPPDTDESEEEQEMEVPLAIALTPEFDSHRPQPALWTPHIELAGTVEAQALWSRVKTTSLSLTPIRIPRLESTRSKTRNLKPLSINTTQLWSPRVTPAVTHTQGLWFDKLSTSHASATATKVKRATQRPARKSRRMTMLPDILEDPQPLPNKRDTLGLFLFPGGEATDMALTPMHPTFYAPMPGTMTTGNSMMVPGVPTFGEYLPGFGPPGIPASFFDMEEEDAGDNFDDFDDVYDDDDDDEDFDETTLWEIASLLKSDNVPSRASMFPGQMEGDYDGNEYDEQSYSSEPASSRVVSQCSAESLADPVHLWKNEALHIRAPKKTHGLPHPQDSTWKAYTEAATSFTRAPSRSSSPSTITSSDLWAYAADVADEGSETPKAPLWITKPQVGGSTLPQLPATSRLDIPMQNMKKSREPSLWAPLVVQEACASPRMWAKPEVKKDPELIAETVAIDLLRRARPRTDALPAIHSMELWSVRQLVSDSNRDWSHATCSNTISNESFLWTAPASCTPRSTALKLWTNGDENESSSTSFNLVASELPRKTRKDCAPLPSLTSTGVWTKEEARSALKPDWSEFWAANALPGAQSSVSTSRLWASQQNSPAGQSKAGLWERVSHDTHTTSVDFYPETSRMPRNSRSRVAPLPKLVSQALWTAGDLVCAAERPHWITMAYLRKMEVAGSSLWAPSFITNTTKSVSGLWNSTSPKRTSPNAHFEPRTADSHRRARHHAEPMPQITSIDLWSMMENAPVAQRDWSTVSSISSMSGILTRGLRLWQSPVVPSVKPSFEGLWNVNYRRENNMENAIAQSAAADKPRRARSLLKPISKLESTELWSAEEAKAKSAPDWTKILLVQTSHSTLLLPSGIKAVSQDGTTSFPFLPKARSHTEPFVISTADQPPESRRRAQSVWTTVQPIWSTIGAPFTFVSQEPQSSKPVSRRMTTSSADWATLREGVSNSEPLPDKHAIRRAAASPANWDNTLRDALSASYPLPARVELLKRVAASPADWDAALQEAIKAGQTLQRIAATESDWDAALQDALRSSYIQHGINHTDSYLWKTESNNSPVSEDASRRETMWSTISKPSSLTTVTSANASPIETPTAAHSQWKRRSTPRSSPEIRTLDFSDQTTWIPEDTRAKHDWDWLSDSSM